MGKIYKIYRESNYIRVIDITTKELYNGAVKEVFVDKSNVQKNEYTLFNVKHFDETAVLAIGKILKEDGSAYSVSEWETFYTENTGNFNGGGTAPTINTAFVEEPYTATMSVAYNTEQPNFEVYLTGDLDLTISGTSNGDSGMVNLYFSATETATLNGFTDLVVTGDGEMIPVYFIHDSDGVKWYNDVTGGIVDNSLFALQDGTILYHIFPVTNIGTFSNVGNICVGTGTNMNDFWIGSKVIKSNGETAILATVTDGTHFTTMEPFATDNVNTSFEVRSKATEIKSDGSVHHYRANCEPYAVMNPNGSGTYNAMSFDSNGNVTFNGFLFGLSSGEAVIKQDGSFKANIPSYVDDAEATSDTNLPSNYFYRVGKEVRIK